MPTRCSSREIIQYLQTTNKQREIIIISTWTKGDNTKTHKMQTKGDNCSPQLGIVNNIIIITTTNKQREIKLISTWSELREIIQMNTKCNRLSTTGYLPVSSDSPRREMTSRVVSCLGGEATARPIPAEIYRPCCGRRHSLSVAKSSAETQTHLFNDTGNTFYLWLYGVGYMVREEILYLMTHQLGTANNIRYLLHINKGDNTNIYMIWTKGDNTKNHNMHTKGDNCSPQMGTINLR